MKRKNVLLMVIERLQDDFGLRIFIDRKASKRSFPDDASVDNRKSSHVTLSILVVYFYAAQEFSKLSSTTSSRKNKNNRTR